MNSALVCKNLGQKGEIIVTEKNRQKVLTDKKKKERCNIIGHAQYMQHDVLEVIPVVKYPSDIQTKDIKHSDGVR